MDEEIIIDQEYIEAAKAEMLKNPKLQPCQLCMHFDAEKNGVGIINRRSSSTTTVRIVSSRMRLH